jgi:secondary thiamine-phosphate synthase enzyme
MHQKKLTVTTQGRGSYEITHAVQQAIVASGVKQGLCHIFVHHTSASLMLCENADPSVRADLERFMQRLAPDGGPDYEHSDEGPDDMPAHIRTVLTQSGLTIPVSGQRADLGTWQGIYLWEHRTSAYTRKITVTVF